MPYQQVTRKKTPLERALLNETDIHTTPYHGRISAWDTLSKREENRFQEFIDAYFKSLRNKHVRERVSFIEHRLKQNQYRPLEEVLGESIETTLQTETPFSMRSGQRYYVKFEDSLIVALQIGQRPIIEGMHLIGAHIDSPGIVGRIRKLDQNYNLCYFLCTIRGGLMPKDFFNTPMSLYFHGTRSKGKRKDTIVDFSLGELNGEPHVIFPEQSYHLDEEEESPKIHQLQAIVGNKPYPSQRVDPRKRIKLNVAYELFKQHKITEFDLE